MSGGSTKLKDKELKDILDRLEDVRNHALTAAERLEAAQEIKLLRTASSGTENDKSLLLANLKAKMSNLQFDLACLEKTLEFYADQSNWRELTVDYGANYASVSGSAPAYDYGKLARKALKTISKK